MRSLTETQRLRRKYALDFTHEYLVECGVPRALRPYIIAKVEAELDEAFARGETAPVPATEALWRERSLRRYLYEPGDTLTA